MILLFALAAGLLVGLGWARWRKEPYQAPAIQALWLAFIAFLPQLIIAYLPASRHLLPDWIAALSLSLSLILFLAFAWINRRLPGMPILLIGLLLNLAVILANGGWMPISPEAVSRLAGPDAIRTVSLGSRIGQKDILLSPQDTRLEFLSDRFLLPDWLPHQVAFSLGDVFIAAGIFWLLARPKSNMKRVAV
ncbi:MAG: DUF5317 domain-containing protein [Chloroflexi bacterium]|nr:DUF5317 domain-containing protein [Chloroflexota bacterium]